MNNPKVKIYVCGGAGIDIANLLGSKYDISHIDTSDSNIRRSTDTNRSYLIEGLDGGGQDRKKNAQQILNNIPPFLGEHPPGDYNFVIFASTGATGSVAGPKIIDTLLERGENVVGFVAMSNGSPKHVENNMGCFQTLQAIVKKQQRPVNIIAESLEVHGNSISKLDAKLALLVQMVSTLVANSYDRLDTSDIQHFFDYDKVTSFEPRLGTIGISTSEENLAAHKMGPISVVSLFTDLSASYDPSILNHQVEYSTAGYTDQTLTDGHDHELPEVSELHFVIEYDRMVHIRKEIESHDINFKRARESRKAADNAFDSGGDDTFL